MTQVLAILLDSLRELRSRSLFWIALVVSFVVSVLLFGMIGFDETGWHILWFDTHSSTTLRAGTPAAAGLLTWLFGGVLLWWWLTWGAIILALITSANTIPEFVSGGSIDLVLCRPIARLRLYAVKIVGAMLFMLLQVTICVLVAYLLTGVRFGMWFHGAWLAVPLVTLQFLYLFAIMALVGMVTRSALASLLATLIFWGVVSLVQFAANQLERTVAETTVTVERSQKRIEEIRTRAVAEGRDLSAHEQSQIASAEAHARSMTDVLSAIEPWHRPIATLELFVPKTGDIQKIVANQVNAPTFAELMMTLEGFDAEAMARMAGTDDTEQFRDMEHAGVAGARAVRGVNAGKSIATSLAFTLVVLGLSAWIFCRRDF